MRGCAAAALVARQLGVSWAAARRWLSAWAEVVGPAEREGRGRSATCPRTAADFELLRLAAKARGDNGCRLDEREALRRAEVFLGRLCPATGPR